MKAVIIAGIQSGIGKTTISIAIMGALKNSGKNIAPFKVGPDYIDPKFHRFVTKNNSYNLDSWMLDEKGIQYLFHKNSKDKDIAVIEGVMGLYDGFGSTSIGSTAHVAKILDIPVILIADATGISTSIAAMISGYRDYDKNVKIGGIILNRVSGDKHYNLLKEVIERDAKIECLGYLPANSDITLKSRHLGLIPVEELEDLEGKIDNLAKYAMKYINLSRLEDIASSRHFDDYDCNFNNSIINVGKGLKIAVALDEAFNFYYHDNLNLMKETGAELIEFSPLHDKKLPDGIHGLYLGGGFPEIFADKLSRNVFMLEDIKNKALNNMPMYAECGGLMYLTTGIVDTDSKFYNMVNFFCCKTKMTDKLQRFGYVEIETCGLTIKAHEFHHTIIEDIDENDFVYKYIVKKPGTDQKWKCGLFKNNVLAAYAHVHFYAHIEFFKKIMLLYRRKFLHNSDTAV